MPAIEHLTKGDVIATRTIDINRADLIRYAGASKDFNPIHWSDATAQQAELPGVIAHGMLSMGLAVDVVTEWTEDPTAIIDYQTRFSAMVPVVETTQTFDPARPFENPNPGAALNVTAKIGAINEETRVVRVDLSVTNPADDDARVLTRAQVQVQL
ncbi:MaoC/PaaZ C-terminal domain-containing protein [Yaniella halotolerans]|uniref:MaoC/PaaZ C-terminal domain-containing protein n=1 Tax=Yaniella halotolerans TaxID=225453 RepID=UPI0003B4F543|nr:MaoC/PaaZ C-terminal domain-containing protein [Yaniella halotolerans]